MQVCADRAHHPSEHEAGRSDDQTENCQADSGHDSGLWCLMALIRIHGLDLSPAQLHQRFGNRLKTLADLQGALKALGFRVELRPDAARCVQRGQMSKWPNPLVVRDAAGRFCLVALHAVTGAGAPGDAGLHDPPAGQGASVLIQTADGALQRLTQEMFASACPGALLVVQPTGSSGAAVPEGSYGWLWPSLMDNRGLLFEVLCLSVVLQLLALVMPLFFQVVMDKVLVNQAETTLNVIATGLLVCCVFEALLGGVRSAALARLGAHLDAELGSRVFRHALSLPLAYFDARSAGDTPTRLRELDNLRAFITGSALTAVLDMVFSVGVLVLMLSYSVALTGLVVIALLLYAGLAVVCAPLLRTRFDERSRLWASQQSFLAETFGNVTTLKAQSLEWRWQQRWERLLADCGSSVLRCAHALLFAQGSISFVSRLLTIGILWIGAGIVMQRQLTVGGLVAFNMLAGLLSSPVLRLANLWNDCQQAGLSLQRIHSLLKLPSEAPGRRVSLEKLTGAIQFDRVSFRYQPESPPVIDGVSFGIRAGEVIGIVGASGSGKSTLVQLLQRLHVPQAGRLLVDGMDVSLLDVSSLRSRIGVVQQEPRLFSGSVRDNIAIAFPGVSIAKVIEAARLAGAHDFICRLPHGYETVLGEQGVGLSGGQRQRIAIARALLCNPRILIFDEATSALDVETELRLQNSMRAICTGRTVIIIAHRLSAVRHAQRILVMEAGRLVESGTPAMLLQNPQSRFRRMHQIQSGAPS